VRTRRRAEDAAQDAAASIRDALLNSLVRDAREQNQRGTLQHGAIPKRINENSEFEADLAALMEFVNEIKGVVVGLEAQVVHVYLRLDALGEFGHKLPTEDFKLAYATNEWFRRVMHAADSCFSVLEEDKVHIVRVRADDQDRQAVNAHRAGLRRHGTYFSSIYLDPNDLLVRSIPQCPELTAFISVVRVRRRAQRDAARCTPRRAGRVARSGRGLSRTCRRSRK
jgi:hypothetical protein